MKVTFWTVGGQAYIIAKAIDKEFKQSVRFDLGSETVTIKRADIISIEDEQIEKEEEKKMYSYIDSMIEDIRAYISENYDTAEITDLEKFYDDLNDELWTEDSVTGNASGSYTMSRAKAKENIFGDPDAVDYILDAAQDFGISDETVGEKFLAEDWEYFDVTIRCWLLSTVIPAVFDTLGLTD